MKLIFINAEDKKIKAFKTLEELSNHIEKKAFNKYKKTFMKDDGKVFEFVLYKQNKVGTIKSYMIYLQKNKRLIGYVHIPICFVPIGVKKMPKDSFTIKVDKTKYKGENK